MNEVISFLTRFTGIIPIHDYNPKGQTGVIGARIGKVESNIHED